jgi:DNA-directed RNA polymerase subunit RPC12/RpoP
MVEETSVLCQGCLARLDQAEAPGACPSCGATVDEHGCLVPDYAGKRHEFRPDKARPAPYSATFFRCLDCGKFEDDNIHGWEDAQ